MDLTQESIKSMNAGRKMDSLVAELIMGATGVFSVGEHWFINDSIKNTLPFYSTDLASAWEVIEKVQSEWSWDMEMINLAKEIDVRIGNGYYFSTSLPEAICKASLLNILNSNEK